MAVLFVVVVVAANTRIVQGIIPVTAYETDVNKDARVNSGDLGLVASKFGQPVPTATPQPTPTATPIPWTWDDFQANVDARSYHRVAEIDEVERCSSCSYRYTVMCDWGDRLRSWSPLPPTGYGTGISETDATSGSTRHGMYIILGGGNVYPGPADLFCFDEYPLHEANWCFTVAVPERARTFAYCRP
jgi:hypothetical protein